VNGRARHQSLAIQSLDVVRTSAAKATASPRHPPASPFAWVEARLIGESPCRGIKLPRVGRVEQRFLTALEVERLACEIDPQFSTLIYAGAYLGARWGELVGLKRERVNLLKRR
jgi:integrase